jgi:hypothetical protein
MLLRGEPADGASIETLVATSAEASCLAPVDGIPSTGAWLGAFTSPADEFIRTVNVGVVAGVVSGRSQAPFAGNTGEQSQAPPAGERRDAG